MIFIRCLLKIAFFPLALGMLALPFLFAVAENDYDFFKEFNKPLIDIVLFRW